MPRLMNIASLRTAAIVVVGGLSLSACATRGYVDERIAAVNTRIDAVEARVAQVGTTAQDGVSRADAANRTAQQAATDAQAANQRLDQMTGRIDRLEQMRTRTPRN